jgi:hypothetical protein
MSRIKYFWILNIPIMFSSFIITIFFIYLIIPESKETKIKQIEIDEYGNYIVYKSEYSRGKNRRYTSYLLKTDYGLRIEPDLYNDWDIYSINLYDGINGIEYIIKSIDNLENIISNFPSGINIYLYNLFHGGYGYFGKGPENLQNIYNILKNHDINFIYEMPLPYEWRDENYDPKLFAIEMDNCFHGEF